MKYLGVLQILEFIATISNLLQLFKYDSDLIFILIKYEGWWYNRLKSVPTKYTCFLSRNTHPFSACVLCFLNAVALVWPIWVFYVFYSSNVLFIFRSPTPTDSWILAICAKCWFQFLSDLPISCMHLQCSKIKFHIFILPELFLNKIGQFFILGLQDFYFFLELVDSLIFLADDQFSLI